jgi:hypothetical protein
MRSMRVHLGAAICRAAQLAWHALSRYSLQKKTGKCVCAAMLN